MNIDEMTQKIEQEEDRLIEKEEKKRKDKMLVSGRSVFEINRLKNNKNKSYRKQIHK